MNQKLKLLAGITLIMVLGGIVAVGCQSLTTPPPEPLEQPMPGSDLNEDLEAPQEITWEAAQDLILSGDVAQVFQSHALEVHLEMKDGTRYVTTEPEIDDVFAVVEACGTPCDDIILATE